MWSVPLSRAACGSLAGRCHGEGLFPLEGLAEASLVTVRPPEMPVSKMRGEGGEDEEEEVGEGERMKNRK